MLQSTKVISSPKAAKQSLFPETRKTPRQRNLWASFLLVLSPAQKETQSGNASYVNATRRSFLNFVKINPKGIEVSLFLEAERTPRTSRWASFLIGLVASAKSHPCRQMQWRSQPAMRFSCLLAPSPLSAAVMPDAAAPNPPSSVAERVFLLSMPLPRPPFPLGLVLSVLRSVAQTPPPTFVS